MAIALIFLTFFCGIPGANSFHQLEKGFIYQSTHEQSRSIANKILDGLLPEITVILEVYYVIELDGLVKSFFGRDIISHYYVPSHCQKIGTKLG